MVSRAGLLLRRGGRPNRIVIADPVFQAIRKQRALAAIDSLDKTLHHKPSPVSWRDSNRPHVFTQSGPEGDISCLELKEAANGGRVA